MTAWLARVLEPTLRECKFEREIPLEIRQTGNCRGYMQDKPSAPDRRVCLSSQVVLWSEAQISITYLHECTHRLLEPAADVESHGVEFFTLFAALLIRSKFSVASLRLYDLQDCPKQWPSSDSNWRFKGMQTGLEIAAEMGRSGYTAEEMAAIVVSRWQEEFASLTRREVEQMSSGYGDKTPILVVFLYLLGGGSILFNFVELAAWTLKNLF